MATETTNLKLNKPDKTDFYNIDLVNDNMDKIDKAIGDKANKTDIPSKLPANGGNADTVGGFHVNNLVQQIGRQDNTTIISNNNYKTNYECSIPDTLSTSLGLPNCWWHLKYFRHQDNNGFGVQMAFPLNNGTVKPMYRLSNGTNGWLPWKYFADSGNADTVDGYHVEVRPQNFYGLRPIAMDTFDLQAGVTVMNPGQIYIMYE